MAPPTTAVSVVKSVKSIRPKVNPARLKKPSPLPQRPLEPDRFRRPRGEKQIFLPNFTLTFLRPQPYQPSNFASFLTPLWMNKFDLKDYLYNLYSVKALHVRSFIIHGKVFRDDRTGRLSRRKQKKKMTIEMKAGDNFVWPDVPADLEPWDKKVQDAGEKEKREMQEGRSGQGQNLQKVPEGERRGLKEQARALLEGRAKWRPGWEEYGKGVSPVLSEEARSSAAA